MTTEEVTNEEESPHKSSKIALNSSEDRMNKIYKEDSIASNTGK